MTIGDDCEKECAIELIMKLQMHFGIVQQTLETAEDYDANPEWFKKNLGKINRELDHDLTCQCGEQVDIHEQVESIIVLPITINCKKQRLGKKPCGGRQK